MTVQRRDPLMKVQVGYAHRRLPKPLVNLPQQNSIEKSFLWLYLIVIGIGKQVEVSQRFIKLRFHQTKAASNVGFIQPDTHHPKPGHQKTRLIAPN